MQSNYIPAGLLKRYFAHLFDIIILSIITIVIGGILVVIYSLFLETDKIPDKVLEYLAYGLLFVISWLYYTLMEISPRQATIGKQAMGIFVTDLNGYRLSFKRASVRNCCKFILIFIWNISSVTMFFTEKKQSLHDIMSRTLVVQKVKNEN
ncbi:RDD family protein [Calothrix sp. PCC 6303]|uniref:RDD family protein n=1 Tax=Calothrix sp. PCC 6303 TaxID=1170562 RepID=UPI0002A043BD|nr:RDD family protein [Calothrix sp. PCC 6303]AFZ01712.1 RDD domain containing protein [Calothrix sp. PCC 6303]